MENLSIYIENSSQREGILLFTNVLYEFGAEKQRLVNLCCNRPESTSKSFKLASQMVSVATIQLCHFTRNWKATIDKM